MLELHTGLPHPPEEHRGIIELTFYLDEDSSLHTQVLYSESSLLILLSFLYQDKTESMLDLHTRLPHPPEEHRGIIELIFYLDEDSSLHTQVLYTGSSLLILLSFLYQDKTESLLDLYTYWITPPTRRK